MKLVGGSGNTNNIKLSLNKKMLFSSTWGTLQCVSWLLLDSPLDPKAKAPWLWNLGLLLFPGLVCPFQFLLFLTVSQCHWGLAWTSALFPVTWISLGSCEPSPVSYSGTRPLSSCFPFPILWIPESPYNLSVLLVPGILTLHHTSNKNGEKMIYAPGPQGGLLGRPLWFHQLNLFLPWRRMLC